MLHQEVNNFSVLIREMQLALLNLGRQMKSGLAISVGHLDVFLTIALFLFNVSQNLFNRSKMATPSGFVQSSFPTLKDTNAYLNAY